MSDDCECPGGPDRGDDVPLLFQAVIEVSNYVGAIPGTATPLSEADIETAVHAKVLGILKGLVPLDAALDHADKYYDACATLFAARWVRARKDLPQDAAKELTSWFSAHLHKGLPHA